MSVTVRLPSAASSSEPAPAVDAQTIEASTRERIAVVSGDGTAPGAVETDSGA
jgi:hypothetical protein